MREITKKLDEIKKAFKCLDQDKTTIIYGIINSACSNNGYYYWPLCLDDERDKNSFEIDTCSTSYCVSTLATMKTKGLSGDLPQKIDEYINGGLKTLLKLRRKDGTFPPVIFVEKLNKQADYNGGIAMSDNYFALNALIDAGFLNEEVNYDLPKKLRDRVDCIFKTIKYFEKTMVFPSYDIARVYGGWYYTNEQDKQPVFLTTANVVILLTKLAKILNRYEYDYISEVNSVIQSLLGKAGAFLEHVLSYSVGNSKGISAVHSCKMIDAMISMHKSEFDDNIAEALDKTILPSCNERFLNDTYQYSERYQILNDVKTKKYQNILHESYPESVMLYTLVNVLGYSLQPDTLRILKDYLLEHMSDLLGAIAFLMNKLIDLKRPLSSELTTLFKSHIRRNDGDYPIYASAESYRAINAWADLSALFDAKGTDSSDLAMYVVEQLRGDGGQDNDLIEQIEIVVKKIKEREAIDYFSSPGCKAEVKQLQDGLAAIKNRIITRASGIELLQKEYSQLIAWAKNRGLITD